jgi:hypothetical protein
MVLRGAEDGVPCRLGSRSGCRRYGDPWDGRFFDGAPVSDHFCVVEWVAAVGEKHCDGLCCVDGASSSHRDDMITSGIASNVCSEPYPFKVGFARDLDGFDSRVSEGSGEG